MDTEEETSPKKKEEKEVECSVSDPDHYFFYLRFHSKHSPRDENSSVVIEKHAPMKHASAYTVPL